ncbi:MAG TPA: protein kinase [Verrucomicrobiae bacterium]|nr:protein kinase [Verrucomicrobiae bacterium]
MNTFEPVIASMVSDALSRVFLLMLGLLVVLAIVTGIIALLSLLRSQLGGRTKAGAQNTTPAAETEIIPRTCPQCGTNLRGDVAQGLCPACVMKQGIDSAPGVSQQHAFIPPTLEELAKLFPQLEILGPLGKGGMGAVYKARQPALDRNVALKILAPPNNELDFGSRFSREARALARLNHPNIVAVYDFGQAGGLSYFIMEFVDGRNLRQVQQAGRLTPREALAVIPQICAALQFAHDEGIVHRDIKPENVLLDRKGRVKIADFGLAKILGQEPADFRLTGAKDIMGTPHYMAPEQVENPQDVDHRADIYSLGVVFYEMLTGELPLGRFQPPSAKVQVDVRLDDIVLRALEKEPERRYQQASHFKTRVETFSSNPVNEPVPPPLPGARASRAKSIALFAMDALAATLLIVLGWAAYRMGNFFNVLFLCMLLAIPVYIGLVLWRLYRGALELRLWRTPFIPGLRQHRWAVINKWLFWICTVCVLETCIVPAQFTANQYAVIRALYLACAVILILLELLPGKRIQIATNLSLAAGSLFIATQLVRIHWSTQPASTVVLASPVAAEWLVGNGGPSALVNLHYTHLEQRHALDLIRIVNGQDRQHARSGIDDYFAWNEPVYAPADATVANVVDGLPDNPIGRTDPNNPAGNHIVLRMTNGVFVMLGHLQKASILVRKGDPVKTGQLIARVGNSGNTSQPHLHIQVQNQTSLFDAETKTFPIAFQPVDLKRAGWIPASPRSLLRRNDRFRANPNLIRETRIESEVAAPAPAAASKPQPALAREPQPLFIASLGSREPLHMVAIGKRDGTNEAWWDPRGVLMTNAPQIHGIFDVLRPPVYARSAGESIDKYVVLFTPLGAIHGFEMRNERIMTAPRASFGRGRVSHFSSATIEVPPSQTTLDCDVVVNQVGTWLIDQPIPGFQSGDAAAIRITAGGLKWNVNVQLTSVSNSLILTGSHPIYWNEGWTHSLNLLSGSGASYNYYTNESTLDHGAITLNHVNLTFRNLTMTDVAGVRFRIAPMRRFRIEDVSLRPGRLSEPRVSSTTRWTEVPDDFRVESLPETAATNESGSFSDVDTSSLTNRPAAFTNRLSAALDILAFTKRDAALAQLARDAAEGGDVETARQALRAMVSFSARDEAAGASARHLAHLGRRNEAMELARMITSFARRDAALRELANQ